MKREWGTRFSRRVQLAAALVAASAVLMSTGPGSAASDNAIGPGTTGGSAATTARPVPGTTAFKVVTHNVQRKRPAVDAAIAQAQRYGARAIFLQELCRDDFSMLRERFGRRWTLSFQPKGVHRSRAGARVCVNERYPGQMVPDGVAAIWTGGKTGTPRRFLFRAQDAKHGDKSSGLACVLYASSRVRLCSVHSVYGDTDVRKAQHQEIRDLTASWVAAGSLVVLGGDFNTVPTGSAMRSIYVAGRSAGGRFREVSRAGGMDCRCGAGTTGRKAENRVKFDYIFFSSNAMAVDARRASYALPSRSTTSDHRMLRGYAEVSLPR